MARVRVIPAICSFASNLSKVPVMTRDTAYIPALRFYSLTRIFDPLLRALLKDEKFRGRLITQADIKSDQCVLDIGCGTGTLALLINRAVPGAKIVGIDGDPDILRIARDKAARADVDITFIEGLAHEVPLPSASCDCVVSSLVLHHLTTESKRGMLTEVFRLLRPGGTLHIADWGQAQNLLMRAAFFWVQLLDGFETTADSVGGRLIALLVEAGFANVRETHHEMTLLGTLSLYEATRL